MLLKRQIGAARFCSAGSRRRGECIPRRAAWELAWRMSGYGLGRKPARRDLAVA